MSGNFFWKAEYNLSEGTSPCPNNSGIMDEIKHDRAEAHSTPGLRCAFLSKIDRYN